MKFRSTLALLAAFASICLPVSATPCESLTGLSLPHVFITSAKTIPPGRFVPDSAKPIENLPGFCRVEATLTPSPDSAIRIEVWMPGSGWNGKFEGTGNGGYAGGLSYGALADGLRRGYAVANTDMGTARLEMDNADAFIGHPERWTDWGWRATHEMTVAAKQIVLAFYGRVPQRSYFSGCSTGGQQALMEAQRFPGDYDGIVAGAPAHNRTRLHMEVLWDYAVAKRDPADLIPSAKLPLIADAVLNACSNAKAAPSDKFLSYPETCRWQPDTLRCASGDASNCLTTAEVATARSFYSGPMNPVTGASIYPGLPRGSELAWGRATPKTDRPPYDSLFKWVFGPGWDWRSFDFNRDVAAVDAHLASTLNATNPDLGAFKAQGHKLILFPRLGQLAGAAGGVDQLLPLRARCPDWRGGKPLAKQGTGDRDVLPAFPGSRNGALRRRPGFERRGCTAIPRAMGRARYRAGRDSARHIEKDAVTMTRPVCAYPRIAHHKGRGDANSAASFSCKNPGRNESN